MVEHAGDPDAVVVVLDVDRRNCRDFLQELDEVAKGCAPVPNTLSGWPLKRWKPGGSATEQQ